MTFLYHPPPLQRRVDYFGHELMILPFLISIFKLLDQGWEIPCVGDYNVLDHLLIFNDTLFFKTMVGGGQFCDPFYQF